MAPPPKKDQSAPKQKEATLHKKSSPALAVAPSASPSKDATNKNQSLSSTSAQSTSTAQSAQAQSSSDAESTYKSIMAGLTTNPNAIQKSLQVQNTEKKKSKLEENKEAIIAQAIQAALLMKKEMDQEKKG